MMMCLRADEASKKSGMQCCQLCPISCTKLTTDVHKPATCQISIRTYVNNYSKIDSTKLATLEKRGRHLDHRQRAAAEMEIGFRSQILVLLLQRHYFSCQ